MAVFRSLLLVKLRPVAAEDNAATGAARDADVSKDASPTAAYNPGMKDQKSRWGIILYHSLF